TRGEPHRSCDRTRAAAIQADDLALSPRPCGLWRDRCVDGICRFNGQWFDVYQQRTSYVCRAGRFGQAGASCDPCPPNSYKPLAARAPARSAKPIRSRRCPARRLRLSPGNYRSPQLDGPGDAVP
uniref:BPTI/Kunitz inhibitor domain-containing protein n=1 Tax=Macrostomum lignano TaxID=282301 RepID=A0A1I8FCX0_9PLAT